MTEDEIKRLRRDPDGLLSYEYLANHIGDASDSDIEFLAENIISVDMCGQMAASAAQYLDSIDHETFKPLVRKLVAAVIDKDREHKYLPGLLAALYGDDCAERADELSAGDDNFRRIYKRLYPEGKAM